MKSKPATRTTPRHDVMIWLVLLAVGLITLPQIAKLPKPDLDNSWMLGLNMGIAQHMQFGQDLIFTFGPLGFLWRPIMAFPGLWMLSVIATLAAHFALICLTARLLAKSAASLTEVVITAAALLLAMYFTDLDYKLVIAALILLYMAMTGWYKAKWDIIAVLIAASFFLAMASLIKFSAALLAIATIGIVAIVMIWRKQLRDCAVVVAAYAVSLACLWVAAGQKASTVIPFIANSWQIASGYGGAMQLWINDYYSLVAGAAIIAAMLMLGYAVVKRQSNLWLFLLLNLSCLAMLFKHGFVRSDDHIYRFFAHAMIIFCLLLPVLRTVTADVRRVCFPITLLCLAAMAGFSIQKMWPLTEARMQSNFSPSTWSLVGQYITAPGPVTAKAKDQMRQFYGLHPKTVTYIGDATMDVFTLEIAIAYAYDLNWSCRPVFQSYTAYTAKLDNIDARYLASENGPKILLLDPFGIDGRFFAFDEPATLRVVDQYYAPVFVDGRYTVLKRRDKPLDATERPVLSTDADCGARIAVPAASPDSQIFARIYMHNTVAGKLVSTVYKQPLVVIDLTIREKSKSYRMVPSVAENGLPLTGVNAFVITPQIAHLYSNRLHIEFFEVRLSPQGN